MKNRVSVFLSTLFGIGYIPIAPGTMGTIFAATIFYFVAKLYLPSVPWWLFNTVILGVTVIIYFAGVALTSEAEKKLGHDSGKIVIDELVGYLVSILFLPTVSVGRLWAIVLYTFIFFRVFDIAKPWPINNSQKLKSGWGIMTDDVIAGIYANILAQIIIKIYPKFFGIY